MRKSAVVGAVRGMGGPASAKAAKSAAPDDPFSPTLRAWFRDNGIVWTGLRFEEAEGRGVYGVAASDLELGNAIIAVPKAAMLTHRNAADAKPLSTLLELGLPSVEVLALAVALERKAGKSSRWHPYLQSLPKAEPLPLLWSASELRGLAGTGLDGVSRRRRRRLLDNYNVVVAEWAGATPPQSAHEYLGCNPTYSELQPYLSRLQPYVTQERRRCHRRRRTLRRRRCRRRARFAWTRRTARAYCRSVTCSTTR